MGAGNDGVGGGALPFRKWRGLLVYIVYILFLFLIFTGNTVINIKSAVFSFYKVLV